MSKQFLNFTMERMDAPLNTDKLQQIFKAITAGHLPRDDTMIEKLEGTLKCSIRCDESWVERSNIVSSLSLLLEQASPHPQAVAFYLKTVSYIPRVSGTPVCVLSWHLYEKVLNCDLWSTAAVRCAWLKGLCNLANKAESSTSVIDWIVQDSRASKLLGALTDSSIFVSKAAVELLAVLILGCPESNGHKGDTTHSPPSQQLSQMFWNLFHESLTERTSLRYALLLVIEKVVDTQSLGVLETICHKHCVLDGILSILGSSQGGADDAERKLCLQILDHCESVVSTGDVSQYEKSAISLTDGGDVKIAMTLSCWMLTRHGTKLKDKKALEDIVFAVISLCASSESKQSSWIHEQVETRSVSALGLILTQLDVMRTYHNKLDIPLKYLHAMVDLLCGVESQLSTSLLSKIRGREVTMKQSLLDTLNHIFKTRPGARNKPLMILLLMASSRQVDEDVPVSLVHKVLKIVLTSLVYLTCSVDFDKERDPVMRTTNDPDYDVDDLTENNTEESPGAMVEEVVSAWSMTVCVSKRLLTDTRWEITDSVIELLTQILKQVQGASFIRKAFYIDDLGGLGERILALMDHSESYLRASAMKCVGSMAAVPEIWEQIIETHSKEALLEKVIEIVKDDSEAFARRGAVDLLSVFFSLECYKENQSVIEETMCRTMNDLDWEVKRNILEFWTNYISNFENNLSNDADLDKSKRTSSEKDMEKDMFVSSISNECLKALLQAALDCDKTVQQKACEMLKPINARMSDAPSCKKQRSSEKLPVSSAAEQTTTRHAGNCRKDLLEELAAIDLDSLINMSSLSTDQYDLQPEALLDDILVSVGQQCQDVPDEEGCEDNAIDCY